MDLKNPIVSI